MVRRQCVNNPAAAGKNDRVLDINAPVLAWRECVSKIRLDRPAAAAARSAAYRACIDRQSICPH